MKSFINKKDFNDSKQNIIESLKLKKNDTNWHALSYSQDYYYLHKVLSIQDLIKKYKEINIKDLYPIIQMIFQGKHCNICYTSESKIEFI